MATLPWVLCGVEEAGADPCRAEGLHAHACVDEFDREAFRESDQERLGPGVCGVLGETHEGGSGRDVDDATCLAGDHPRKDGVAEAAQTAERLGPSWPACMAVSEPTAMRQVAFLIDDS